MSQENTISKQPLIRYVNRQQMSWRVVDVEHLIGEDHLKSDIQLSKNPEPWDCDCTINLFYVFILAILYQQQSRMARNQSPTPLPFLQVVEQT